MLRRKAIRLLGILLLPTGLAIASPSFALGPGDIVGMAVTHDTGYTYAWYGNKTVSAGTSDDLSRHRRRYSYVLPKGYTPADIVGIACGPYPRWSQATAGFLTFKYYNATYVFYRDGKYSVGVSNNLAKYQQPKRYSLPPGKEPSDIVGVAYDTHRIGKRRVRATEDMWFFAWYRDGTVSAGEGQITKEGGFDFYKRRKPYQFVAARGETPGHIVGMGCAPNTAYHYAWYRDGTVSAGSSDHLDRHRKRYTFQVQ